MNEAMVFSNQFDHTTIFSSSETAVWLNCLWNIECGLSGTDNGPATTQGLCVLETDEHRYEAEEFHLLELLHEENRIDICWKVGNGGLLWRSTWQVQTGTGIWSRRDQLENSGQATVEIRRCLARIPFSPGNYEIYTQASNWAHENQGHWNEFFGGHLSLFSRSGRTTQIANPYLFIRQASADHGVAFHIIPVGNWSIHVDRTSTTHDELSPFNVIELGLSDNNLQIELAPGKILELPEVLIQDVPSNDPEAGTVYLHRYLLDRYFSHQAAAPIVYNTWFDRFDTLNMDRLRSQLTIAQKIGCEIFTVDAGWYGRGQGDWHRQVGDWREKLDGAFHGKMLEFAKEVREAGMGFGLWVEPERNGPDSPIVHARPEWFQQGLGGFFYPDLSQPSVYKYIYNELSRLIETYQLAWMKVDFNFDLGSSADEFHSYFEHWYQLLDQLRSSYPTTFLEGCSSGGMRLDLNALAHFDAHFLSDTVNPIDVLRITQGAMLRVPAGRITKWAVLRAQDNQIFTPGGGSWENAVLTDVDFICRVALTGLLGISGNLIGIPEDALCRLQHHISFYKEWRKFIRQATCHLLTPISTIDDRSGWIAFQFQNSSQAGISLVYVYRLTDGLSSKVIRLHDIDSTKSYIVTNIDTLDSSQAVSGLDLHLSGLRAELPHTNSATIFIIQEQIN